MYKRTFVKLSEETDLGNDSYSVVMSIGLQIEDGVCVEFSKDIVVTSKNSMTGFEVDAQRMQAVNDFMDSVNNK